MKLYLDDVREAPIGWTRVCSASAAIWWLKTGSVEEVSLDHDLGESRVCGTGYEVASWIEEAAIDNKIPRCRWWVHSSNPVGVARMKAALRNADRAWDGWEASKCSIPMGST
jgi:hypothetical protein